MKLLLALLFVTLFPLGASAMETSEACAVDTWKNEGTLNEMFSEPWPPGIKGLLALGCVPEGDLLKRFFGPTFEETHTRIVACNDGWSAKQQRIDGREEKGVIRLYKDGKAVAGMYSPNLNSMSPIMYSYIFTGPDKVRVVQAKTLEAVVEAEFGFLPTTCVEEKD